VKTQAFPYKEIGPNTYEIGEFDCASIFLLIGDEKAMVIDTGIGIGDLKGFIRRLTDKPLMVCYTHDHQDHVGGASQFDNAWVHPRDMVDFATGGGAGLGLERRLKYIRYIAERQKGTYPYNLEEDVTEWGPCPPLHPLEDEQVIDLGNRRVTVYHCPGHSPGSVAFLDENTRSLFHGDAWNCNLGLRGAPGTHRFVSIEKALYYLKRMRDLRTKYDRCYNGHYDFRALGEPLGDDVLPDAITACEQLVAGTAKVEIGPGAIAYNPPVHLVVIGRTRVSFNPEGIHEPRA